MPSELASAHIEAERRLRVAVVAGVVRIWDALPSYDEENLDEWFSGVLPLVEAAQRASVAVTESFIARFLGRPPLGVDPDHLIGASVRNGTSPQEVYRRPFVSLWSDLGQGKPFVDAASSARARAESAAEMDTQLSMRATAAAVQEAEEGIFGYARAADPGACAFCRLVDGAYVKNANAFPLHNRCGCGLEPLTKPHPRAAELPSGVAVHEHGELGALLADSSHHFTTESEALR